MIPAQCIGIMRASGTWLSCDRNRLLLEKLKARYDSGGKTGLEAVLADAADAPEAELKLLTDLIGRWLRPPDPEAACAALIRTCGTLQCDLKIACINVYWRIPI